MRGDGDREEAQHKDPSLHPKNPHKDVEQDCSPSLEVAETGSPPASHPSQIMTSNSSLGQGACHQASHAMSSIPRTYMLEGEN